MQKITTGLRGVLLVMVQEIPDLSELNEILKMTCQLFVSAITIYYMLKKHSQKTKS